MVAGDVIDVEGKPLIRPIGEQVDERPATELMLKTEIDDLSDAEARQAGAQFGA